MTKVTSVAVHPAHAAAKPGLPGAGSLLLVRRIGFAVLAAKLAAFGVWSAVLYRHFALTPDFAQYQQAWYLIAHGDLNPYDTVGNFTFWQNHAEFIMWPLALFYWVFPNGVFLLWLQDIGVVGAELVAFLWLCEIAQRYRPGRDARWLAGAGLVLLAVNPWSWWSVSFDFHAECLAVLFIALLAWDLAAGRRRAWLWVVPLLACGDVAGTYVFGIGVGLLLAGRHARLRGAIVACLGVAAVLFITAIHGNKGSGHGLQAYDYLAAPGYSGSLTLPQLVSGLATHPLGVAAKLWAKRLDLWANLGSSGLLGLGYLPLLPLVLVVTVSNDLFRGFLFSEPLFQSLPIYVLLPVGTVGVLGWLTRRVRRLGLVATGLVAAQAIGWAAVWVPGTPRQWLRVPGATAATLAAIQARIPASAAVFASQGVVGRFSGRLDVRPLNGNLPIRPGQDWFIFTPWAGIETQKTAGAMVFAGQLAGPLHARLVLDANGVWAFQWSPPPGIHRLRVPGGTLPLPAWTAPGAAGRAVLTGPPPGWHVTSTGREGYVADRLEWQRWPGQYQASVTLSATGPVNVEVWNNTGNTLLARRSLASTDGIQTITVPVDASTDYRTPIFSGWGPFRAQFGGGPRGERLEVRVWTPGDGTVNVYSTRLAPASQPAAATGVSAGATGQHTAGLARPGLARRRLSPARLTCARYRRDHRRTPPVSRTAPKMMTAIRAITNRKCSAEITSVRTMKMANAASRMRMSLPIPPRYVSRMRMGPPRRHSGQPATAVRGRPAFPDDVPQPSANHRPDYSEHPAGTPGTRPARW
ncbi:MAG TPA: DUF2079 domain-containing protein [Streptosporangiaceae bacterium]|nr:DUF2079 domain-containing protein [Streptosporangiaceae bacterium]